MNANQTKLLSFLFVSFVRPTAARPVQKRISSIFVGILLGEGRTRTGICKFEGAEAIAEQILISALVLRLDSFLQKYFFRSGNCGIS